MEEELNGPDQEVYVVSVTSAGLKGGNLARIIINNIPVPVNTNENDHYRGLHVVVLDK